MVSCSVAVGTATKAMQWQKIERILETAENEMYKEKSTSSINFGIHAINGIITSLHMKSPWRKSIRKKSASCARRWELPWGFLKQRLKS